MKDERESSIKEEVLEKSEKEFQDKLSDISSNDEWMMLHDEYIDKIIDLTEQLTRKERWDELRTALRKNEELSQRLDGIFEEILNLEDYKKESAIRNPITNPHRERTGKMTKSGKIKVKRVKELWELLKKGSVK